MTKTEDVWEGTVVEKQIHDSTRERMQRQSVDDTHQVPANYSANLEAALAAIEKQLTGDMNAMHALRREIEEAPASTKAEARIKTAIYERVGKHIADLQQGARAPVVDNNSVRLGARAHTANAENKRELEINRLKIVRALALKGEDIFAPVLATAVARLPQGYKVISMPPRDALLADKTTRDQLVMMAAFAAAYQIKQLEVFKITNIRDRLDELQMAISGETSPEVVAEIQAELQTLRAPEAEDIANRNRRVVNVRA
ncbi:MAG: hypothetical protein AAB370_10770 [Verrucomicrobiota bacterium]